jgi:GH18 family chitinase
MRKEFGSKYLIGLTVSPLRDRIQTAYNLLDINTHVDYANVESYDYYGPWDKRVGLSAPLMQMSEQYLHEAFLNIVCSTKDDFCSMFPNYFWKHF